MGNTPRLCLGLTLFVVSLYSTSSGAGCLRDVLVKWQTQGVHDLKNLERDDLHALPQDQIIAAAMHLKEIKGSKTLLDRLKSLFTYSSGPPADSLQAFLGQRKLKAERIYGHLENHLDPALSLEENVTKWITDMDLKFKAGDPVEPEELLALHAALSEYSFKQVESLLQTNPDIYGYAAIEKYRWNQTPGALHSLLRFYDKNILRSTKLLQKIFGTAKAPIDLGKTSFGLNFEILNAPNRHGTEEVIQAMLETLPIRKLSADPFLKRFYGAIANGVFIKMMATALVKDLGSVEARKIIAERFKLSHLRTPPPSPFTLAGFRTKLMGDLIRDPELEALFNKGNLDEAMSLALHRYGARYALNFLILNTMCIYGGYSVATNLYYDALASDDEKILKQAKSSRMFPEIIDQLDSGKIDRKTAARQIRKTIRKESPIADIKDKIGETKKDVLTLVDQGILETQRRIDQADPESENLTKRLNELKALKEKLQPKNRPIGKQPKDQPIPHPN